MTQAIRDAAQALLNECLSFGCMREQDIAKAAHLLRAALEAQPAGDAGMPVVAMPSDDEMLMAFHSFDWGSVPHQFRGSVGMERGIRWLLDSFGHLVRQRDAQAAIAAERKYARELGDAVLQMRQKHSDAIAARDARIAELEAAPWVAIRLGAYVNGADIMSDDKPVDVITKLQARIDALEAVQQHREPTPTAEERGRAEVLATMKLVEQYGGKMSELSVCLLNGTRDTQFQVAQECSNLHNQIHDALCALVKSTASDATEECAKVCESKGWAEDDEYAAAIRAKFGVKP